MENKTLLQVKNLCIFSKTQSLVKDVDFSIEAGQIFALVGQSGSGKSLTALAVVGLLSRELEKSGKIYYQGIDLMKTKRIEQFRGSKIGFIFQDPDQSLNPVMRLGEQVAECLKLHTNLNKKQRKNQVLKLFEQVDIKQGEQLYERYPHQVSGGQKQRIMIAIALAGGAKLLIADEPTTALDVVTQKQVLSLLLKLRKTQKLSILFITHDLSVVRFMADRVGVIQQGRLIENQAKTDFFNNPIEPYSKDLLALLPAKKSKAKDGKILLSGKNIQIYFPIKTSFLQMKKDYIRAVDGVNFALKRGQSLAIVGESGSGKTTLAKAIMRQVRLYDGDILLMDNAAPTAINNYSRKTYACQVQIVFQNIASSFNPRLRVSQTLLEVLSALNPSCANLSHLYQLLQTVELPKNLLNRYPHQLSGGQLQRLSIARALSANPQIIICDEPTSALDANKKAQILDLLLKLQREKNISYIMITHDISLVDYFADEVMVMKNGKIVEHGNTKNILKNPQNPYTKTLLSAVL